MSSRLLAPLLLVVCVLAFFYPLVLHPTAVLYAPRSDLIALHLPSKLFLADAVRETGEQPLWCPYRFCGDPFVADVQVAAFYPPHLLVPFVPRDYLGAFLSWLVVLHVLIAGLSAYAYARHEGLGCAGSFVVGAGYMFAGKWLLHILGGGHYILIGLAWLPLVLLAFEKAIRERSLGWATATGAGTALIVLGTQPQWTAYAALLAIGWTIAAAIETADSPRALASGLFAWARFGLWTALVAGALCAVQLLPMREAAGLSSRARDTILAFFHDGGISPLRNLVGPSQFDVSWEGIYGVGMGWAMAGVAAMALVRFLPGRPRLYAWALAAVTVFAICRGGPAQICPILCKFRGHHRAFLVAALPLALLVGALTDRFAAHLAPSPIMRRRAALWMTGTGLACLLGLIWHAVDMDKRWIGHLYWFTLPLTAPALIWLASSARPWQRGWGVAAWCGLLAADVFTLVCPTVDVRSQAELYRPSPCVRYVAAQRDSHGRVYDVVAPGQPFLSPLGNGVPLALIERLDAIRGYNPVDVARFRDYIQLIADRSDNAYPTEVLNDLSEANPALFDLLGVRFQLQSADAPAPGPEWRPVFRDETPIPAYHHQFGDFPPLPPYVVYENEQAVPRAFVVPEALRTPAQEDMLETLKCIDLRRMVLLDHYHPDPAATVAGDHRPARIVKYEPNRVVVEAEAEGHGWLVLADVWYPGWRATVDGQAVQLFRADYSFRAVELPPGRHEVVFRFNPNSYRAGRAISLCALGALAVFGLAVVLRKVKRIAAGGNRFPAAPMREAA